MMDLKAKKTWISGGVSLVGIVGAAWGWSAYNGADSGAISVPKELTLTSLQEKAKEPEKLIDTMRDAYRREDLTEEQRQQVRKNMRTVFEAYLDLRMNEYFSAPEEAKQKILDKHIDEFQERMKQWRARRAESDRAERNREGGDHRGRRGWASRTQAERKARSESRDADKAAHRITYFNAMRQRMAARGIQSMWRGRGGRSGGGSRRTQ